MNAKEFLIDFVKDGSGANLLFARLVSELVNDSAVLNEKQQEFVRFIVQVGPGQNSAERRMVIATFINSCH